MKHIEVTESGGGSFREPRKRAARTSSEAEKFIYKHVAVEKNALVFWDDRVEFHRF